MKWDNRIYRRTILDVQSNVDLARTICFVIAAVSIGVVVLWIVQALLGNLE